MAARQAVQKEGAFRRCGAARPRQRGRLRMCTHGTVLTLPQRRQGHWNGCVAQEKAGKGGRREADRRTRMWCVGSRDVRKRAEEWRGAHPRGLNGRGSGAPQNPLSWRAPDIKRAYDRHSYVYVQKRRGAPLRFCTYMSNAYSSICISYMYAYEAGGGRYGGLAPPTTSPARMKVGPTADCGPIAEHEG